MKLNKDILFIFVLIFNFICEREVGKKWKGEITSMLKINESGENSEKVEKQ